MSTPVKTPAGKRKRGDSTASSGSGSRISELPNPHLVDLAVDYLYHFGLDSSMDLPEMFGHVKFVCMGGTAERMKVLAEMLIKELGLRLPVGCGLVPVCKTERFTMYKAGPVLCVSHGMGMPSVSICLHEIVKLLMHAGARDFIIIRTGTSGGVGVAPGTVVITTEALNGMLENVRKKKKKEEEETSEKRYYYWFT